MESDGFNEDEGFQQVALAPIEGEDEDNDDNGCGNSDLATASSYLRSVMREAKNFPDVAVASPCSLRQSAGYKKQLGPTMRLYAQVMNSPDSKLSSDSSVVSSDQDRFPSEEWQVKQLEQFIMLYHYVEILKARIKENNERGPNIPSANNEFIWCCELYGKDFACDIIDIETIPKKLRKRQWYLKLKEEMRAKLSTTPREDTNSVSETDEQGESSEDDENDSANEVLNERNELILESDKPIREPVLSFMAFLPQKAVECLLAWHYEWFGDDQNYSSNSTVTNYTLNSSNCLWIYSLLAVLEKPVSPDTVFSLRQLCRLCKKLRMSLNINEANYTKDLAALNLIILIITRYFDQHDLADG